VHLIEAGEVAQQIEITISREGFPAVTALVSLVKPELDAVRLVSPREFNAAKQFVGWAVGRIMRNHGHKIVGRSRVPGGLITVGSIWSAEPIRG
jgi:hypothetical protein